MYSSIAESAPASDRHALNALAFAWALGGWLMLAACLYVGFAAHVVRAATPGVTMLGDGVNTAALARVRQVPVLLVVSQDGCPYCKRLREEVIRPMILSGEYRDRVVIRELNMDATEPVRDFDGRMVEARTIADRYQAMLTPTVLLLNWQGEQLTRPIRGFNGAGFYGYYLDKAIARATARLRE